MVMAKRGAKVLPLFIHAGLVEAERPPITTAMMQAADRPLLIVAMGLGRNSVALLVLLYELGIRPDRILFADTGGEKPETYAYLRVLNAWLVRVGFPTVIVLRHNAREDASLEDNCVRLRVLPSQAFNFSSCSDRWKQGPQRVWANNWLAARIAWRSGQPIVWAIGYDATECTRRDKANTYIARNPDDRRANWYPLIEHGLTLDDCILKIVGAGLPPLPKSACFFCPVSKPAEIKELAEAHPHLLVRGLVMERLALSKLTVIKGLGGREFRWRDLEVSQPYLDLVERIVAELDGGQLQSGPAYVARVDELVYGRLADSRLAA